MSKSPLLIRPLATPENGVITRLSAEQAHWQHLNMTVRRFQKGESWTHQTQETECAVVILGGRASVESSHGHWQNLGERETVFDGMPTALYFSRRMEFTVTAESDCLEIAHCWVPTEEDHPAQLIRPQDSKIEIRGGHNATRQINSIIPPGFDCQRLVCVEVFTPHGNWSSYPGHKHDAHIEGPNGEILEADLEEIYYYKIKNQPGKARGYAIQRVYNDDRSLDETVVAHENDIVLIPEGYHPVSAAYGYDCYYLNFLAGSAQSLACTDDPDYAWIKDTWDTQDPRVPLVKHKTSQHKEPAHV